MHKCDYCGKSPTALFYFIRKSHESENVYSSSHFYKKNQYNPHITLSTNKPFSSPMGSSVGPFK